jgi:X-X-X-Leu-X-X-Gly heptad repeat protein
MDFRENSAHAKVRYFSKNMPHFGNFGVPGLSNLASDGLGWPQMASNGLRWPQTASDGLMDGLGWLRDGSGKASDGSGMASDGLGWPRGLRRVMFSRK